MNEEVRPTKTYADVSESASGKCQEGGEGGLGSSKAIVSGKGFHPSRDGFHWDNGQNIYFITGDSFLGGPARDLSIGRSIKTVQQVWLRKRRGIRPFPGGGRKEKEDQPNKSKRRRGGEALLGLAKKKKKWKGMPGIMNKGKTAVKILKR